MFQLDRQEVVTLKSQSVISNPEGRGGRNTLPYAFTEQGVVMLSSVLNSSRAIQVNIEIIRTFVRLRQLLADHEHLREKLEEMEDKYDEQFKMVFEVLSELMRSPKSSRKGTLGFVEE